MDSWRPMQEGGQVRRDDGSAAATTGVGARDGTASGLGPIPEPDLHEVLVSPPLDGAGGGGGGGDEPRLRAVAASAAAAPGAATSPVVSAARAASARLTAADSDDVTATASLRLGTAGSAVLDDPHGGVDERAALLGAWRRSHDVSGAGTPATNKYGKAGGGGGGSGGKEPYGAAAGAMRRTTASRFSGSGAAQGSPPARGRDQIGGGGGGGGGSPQSAATAAAAGRRGAGRSWSPFELSGPAAAGLIAAGFSGPGGAGVGATSPPSRGVIASAQQIERAPSALLTAVTAAGDLHSAVPTPASGVAAAAAASGGGGGGGGSRAFLPGPDSWLLDDNAQFSTYLREEQLRHAAEAYRTALHISRAALKRGFMLAVTGGFLGAAIYLSRTPWGLHESGGLPVWRWFLIVGCLPCVWYVPWIAIFLVVLLLESLLPVVLSESMAEAARSRSAVAAAAGAGIGGGGGGGAGEDAGGGLAGPALLIYHILGVRRHMVRVLRSLAGQLLIHYAVADYLHPEAQSREAAIMKIWTCVTLFLSASALKSMVAKALSKHFHSRGYLQRMQQAVKQELVLMALSRPRPGRARADALTHLGLGYHLANIFGYNGNSAAAAAAGHGHGGGGGGGGGSVHGKSYGGGGGSAARASVGGGGGGGGDAAGKPSLRAKLSVPSTSAAALTPGSYATPQARLPSVEQPDSGQGHGGDASTRGSRLFLSGGGAAAADGGRGSVPGGRGSVRPMYGGVGGGSVGGATPRGSGSVPAGAAFRGGGRSRWRLFWHYLARHFRHTYAKTKMQWDLSRPSASSRRPRAGVGVGGGGGNVGGVGGGGGFRGSVGALGRGSNAGGGGGGGEAVGGPAVDRADGLNYDQLRTSLYWLEQHIRRNKLRMGVTLSDQLRAAAEGGEEEGGGDEVTSKTEAKRLAFYLHMNVLGLSDLKGRKYLVARDFEPFFSTAEEVREAFSVFDSDRDGRITLQNMVDTIVRIYKERKKLALTLQDTRTVVAKLELICGVVVHVLFAFGYLIIFQVNVRELWLTFSSVTLAFVFVFGNSIRSIYEAVLFLFVVHPFDVGDWLLLANGDAVKVEEIALLFCTFVKGDGRRLYYPNTKLIQEAVINISRSGTYWDSATLLVDLATPGSVLEAVEGRLKRWLADNPPQYTGSGGVMARSLSNPAKLQITVSWEYCHNGEDQGRTARWRSKALLVVASALESCGTAYTFPAMKDGRVGREAAAVVGLGLEGEAAGGSAALSARAAAKGGGGAASGGAVTEFGAGAAFTMQGM